MVHFFCIATLLFVAHHLLVGEPRTITITPGLKAELGRRFLDLNGRKPTREEFEKALDQWKRDEALFREALRKGLDRDDPSIRSALVDKMHALAAFEAPNREPSDADLEHWLASHRGRYEMPLRYDFEFVAFPKSESNAREELGRFERAVNRGDKPATLGRPLLGGNLTKDSMKGRLPPKLAKRIPSLPLSKWQRVESDETLWLTRVKKVEGGLPSLEELRPRLVADWSFATRQKAIERILERTVDRYRFEESP